MSTELLKFHKTSKREFNDLLDNFNILFYGYGYKEDLVSYLFDDDIQFFDCSQNYREFLDQIKNYLEPERRKLNDYAYFKGLMTHSNNINKKNYSNNINNSKDKDSYYLIGIKNIKLEYLHFFRLNTLSIRFVGLVDEYFVNYSKDDLELFNIVQRDLTTMIHYEVDEDILEKFLYKCKVSNCVLVVNSVQKKSVEIFKILLTLRSINYNNKNSNTGNSISFSDLIESVKNELLITSVDKINNFLSEFVEHKIITKKNDFIQINLNRQEIEEVLLQI